MVHTLRILSFFRYVEVILTQRNEIFIHNLKGVFGTYFPYTSYDIFYFFESLSPSYADGILQLRKQIKHNSNKMYLL